MNATHTILYTLDDTVFMSINAVCAKTGLIDKTVRNIMNVLFDADVVERRRDPDTGHFVYRKYRRCAKCRSALRRVKREELTSVVMDRM